MAPRVPSKAEKLVVRDGAALMAEYKARATAYRQSMNRTERRQHDREINRLRGEAARLQGLAQARGATDGIKVQARGAVLMSEILSQVQEELPA